MNTNDRRRYDMLNRIDNFSAMHAQRFPTTSPVHGAFAVIAAEVEQLEALDVAARSASQSARAARKAAAGKALADALTRAGHTARVLGKANAQFEVRLELPAVTDDLQLLTIAREFAAKAAPHVEPFAIHGVAIDELPPLIDAFDGALNERGMRRNEQVHVRGRIKASLERAMDAVDTLDVTVANHLRGDSATLAVWKAARRISYRKASRSVSSDAAAPGDPAPDAATPAPMSGAGTVQ